MTIADSMMMLVFLVCLVLVPLALILVYSHRERSDEPRMPLWKALAVGVGLPLMILGVAQLCIPNHRYGPDVQQERILWTMVSGVALLSILPATFVMLRLPGSSRHARSASAIDRNGAKPSHDPDALDVVSRRG